MVPITTTVRETLENLKVGPHRILTPLSQQGFSKGRDWGGGGFPVFPKHWLPLFVAEASWKYNHRYRENPFDVFVEGGFAWVEL